MLLLFGILIGTLNFAQTKQTSIDLALGYAQKGGFNFGISAKNISKNFGGYFHVRGISGAGNFQSGIDYGSAANTILVSKEVMDAEYLGGVIGGLYSINNSGFTVGLGLGYTQEITETMYFYRYDFVYINDEYRSEVEVKRANKITAEILADYKINPAKRNGFGVQVGYNIVHGGFGLLYYSF